MDLINLRKEAKLRLNINISLEVLRVEMEKRILKQITRPKSQIKGYNNVSLSFVEYKNVHQVMYDAPNLTIEILESQGIMIKGKTIAIVNEGVTKTMNECCDCYTFNKSDLSFDFDYCTREDNEFSTNTF